MVKMRWRLLAVASVLMLLPAATASAAEAIHWQTSFSAAKAAAKKSHKLIFADFYADW